MAKNSFEKYLAVVGAMFWVTCAQGAELRYRITDLGLLETPGGVGVPWSAKINNQGLVVGNATIITRVSGFIYQHGTMKPLSLAEGEQGTFINSLNDRGQIVGFANGPAGFPFIYDGGKVTDLSASLGGPLPGSATGINNSGQAVGSLDSGKAFYFDGSRSRYIPIENAVWSGAGPINDAGVAGGAATLDTPTGLVTRGFTYDGHEVKYFTSPDSSTAFYPDVVSDSGRILGHTDLGVYIYEREKFTEIGDIDRTEGGALDMNEKGWVVGGVRVPVGDFFEARAFLYRNDKIYYLNDLMGPGSGSGWQLQRATGINDRGQIVGIGYSEAAGERRGFLATPVPEPGTWMLLVGLCVVGATVSRRQGPGRAGPSGVRAGAVPASWCRPLWTAATVRSISSVPVSRLHVTVDPATAVLTWVRGRAQQTQ